MRWNLSWLVIKDVALTGTAIWIFGVQVLSPHPQEMLLLAALALTAVNGGTHAVTLMSAHGHGQPPPPQPSQPQPSSPTSSPPVATHGE